MTSMLDFFDSERYTFLSSLITQESVDIGMIMRVTSFFSFKFTEKNEQRYRVPITSPNTHSFPLLMSYISVMNLLQLMS